MISSRKKISIRTIFRLRNIFRDMERFVENTYPGFSRAVRVAYVRNDNPAGASNSSLAHCKGRLSTFSNFTDSDDWIEFGFH